MVEIIKKQNGKDAKTDRYTFALSETQKMNLDLVKKLGWDVNEMLRRHADSIIELAKETMGQPDSKAG